MKPTHSRLAALRLSPLSSLHPAGESRPLRVYLDRGLLAATCLVLLAACASARAGTPELSSSATDEQLRPLGAPEAVEETLRWYRDAKLGMLVFWGPFAIYGANSEWVMYTRKIPPAEYRERTMKDLNPVKWDPDAVARMAKDAGCKFIMFTAKFHDGFCWWKTATTDFNIVDGTQYKRDVCRELADACRKHGIRLGFYWSSGKDWMFQYSGGWNSKPRSLEDLAATINIPQVKELFGGYEPLYLWYDGGANPAAGIEETIRINRQMKPDAPISPRSGGGDYQGSGDYNIMDPDVQLAEQFWEGYRNDHTVGSWGYTPKRDEVPNNFYRAQVIGGLASRPLAAARCFTISDRRRMTRSRRGIAPSLRRFPTG